MSVAVVLLNVHSHINPLSWVWLQPGESKAVSFTRFTQLQPGCACAIDQPSLVTNKFCSISHMNRPHIDKESKLQKYSLLHSKTGTWRCIFFLVNVLSCIHAHIYSLPLRHSHWGIKLCLCYLKTGGFSFECFCDSWLTDGKPSFFFFLLFQSWSHHALILSNKHISLEGNGMFICLPKTWVLSCCIEEDSCLLLV